MSETKRCHVLLPDLLCSMTKGCHFDIALVHLIDSTQYPCLLVRPDDSTVRAIHRELVEAARLGPWFASYLASPLQFELHFESHILLNSKCAVIIA